MHLREIYITLLVCFSICHMYRTLLSETNVNDYAKVKKILIKLNEYLFSNFNFQVREDMEEKKKKTMFEKKMNKLL